MVVSSVYLWRMGVFSSQGKPRGFIAGFGMTGGLVFVFIQIVQAVAPIIPGEISCLAGIIYLAWKWDLCIIMHWLCHSKSNMENHCWRKCLSQSCLKNMKADTDAESFCKAFTLVIFSAQHFLKICINFPYRGSGIEGLFTVIRPDIWAIKVIPCNSHQTELKTKEPRSITNCPADGSESCTFRPTASTRCFRQKPTPNMVSTFLLWWT